MAGIKEIIVTFIKERNLYSVIQNKSTNEYWDPTNKVFTSVLCYIPLTEDSILKGTYRYLYSETAWPKGKYDVFAYNQEGATPDTTIDAIVGMTEMLIEDDETADGCLPTVRKIIINVFETGTTIPIPDAVVVLRNSSDTLDIDQKVTDTNGIATMFQEDGTYKLRFRKSMVSFNSTETITVQNQDTIRTYYGTPVHVNIIITPGLQTIYGQLVKIDGTPDVGKWVEATVLEGKVVQGAVLTRTLAKAKSDKDGVFQIQVMKGAYITFVIADYFSIEITVTQDDTRDYILYLPPELL